MKAAVEKFLTLALGAAGLIAIGASVASAQTTDVYKLNYFANNTNYEAPDATVRIDNPGLTYGTLCAMIYVFDADQQMTECCGCRETQNGLRTLSVRNDLTSNPLTGTVSDTGVIKIVSATLNNGTGCNPTGNPTSVTPTKNLRAWATHVQDPPAGPYTITETEFTDSPLGAAELSNLQAQCYFTLFVLGSGQGFCSCGTGD
jgi:hypothetical protein